VRKGQAAFLVLLASTLGGCGSRVPPLQDLPGSEAKTQQFIHEIVHSVHCEIFNAIRNVAPAEFLEGWGAQVLLTLQIDEQTGLNPNGVWMIPLPMPSMFFLGLGATLSQHATRIEKLNFFYSVDSIRALPKNMKCTFPPNVGSLLIQSDLGLYDWLEAEAVGVDTSEFGAPNDPNSIFKQNVLQHEVKFDVVTSGNITPAWKLARATVNQSGSFLSTSRERIHDLLITLGPVDPQAVTGLIQAAESVHLASQINARLTTLP
jgi:hypothetical protein